MWYKLSSSATATSESSGGRGNDSGTVERVEGLPSAELADKLAKADSGDNGEGSGNSENISAISECSYPKNQLQLEGKWRESLNPETYAAENFR